MRNVSLKLAASVLVFISAATPAAAQDKKNYPGLACLASGTHNTHIARDSSGRGLNQTSTTTTFTCPAVKDYVSIAGGIAWVVDQNPSASSPVTCWLRSVRPDTLEVDSSTDTTEPSGGTFSSATPVKLTFTAVDGWSEGAYWLHCSVPPAYNGNRSGVHAYQINENE